MQTRIAVACGIDGSFAMQLAVTLKSLLLHLRRGCHIDAYVMHSPMDDRLKQLIVESLDGYDVTPHWIEIDRAHGIHGAQARGHLSAASYYRLLMGAVLPASVHRVIYLDADLIVLRDLSALWQMGLDGSTVAAARDLVVGTVEEALRAAQQDSDAPLAHEAYFNSGVLVVDLDRWRALEITPRALSLAAAAGHRFSYLDQCILNVLLVGQWVMLNAAWNQQSAVYGMDERAFSVYGAEVVARTVFDPAIVHFTGPVKPWQWESDHAFWATYWRLIDETAWRGWRPYRGTSVLSPAFAARKCLAGPARRMRMHALLRRSGTPLPYPSLPTLLRHSAVSMLEAATLLVQSPRRTG